MYIKSLKLKNYRYYENLEIELNPEYTILVGVNGAGKSTILDALATALGSYIAGFDGIDSNSISQDDVRLKMYELGSRIDAEPQFPVEIETVSVIDGKEYLWKRSLHAKEGRTHIRDAKQIMDYAGGLQKKVREGNKETILPLIAYYGTGRLYMQKRQKKNAVDDTKFTRTTGYVDCLDSASNDKLMMRWFKQMTSIQIQEEMKIPELETVKLAMGKCYAGSENTEGIAEFAYKVKTQEIEITYQKEGKKEKLPMKMLSDGLRSTISMVADIAYRMAVLNPQLLEHILDETPGIVLIDEVDMHLHPEGESGKVNPDRFTCDTRKGGHALHIDPQNLSDMQTVYYDNKRIVYSTNKEYKKDLNEILNLNDPNGYLIRNREAALKALMQKLKSLTPGQDAMPLLRKLEKYCFQKNEEEEYPDYAGILQWYVKRKIKKHS